MYVVFPEPEENNTPLARAYLGIWLFAYRVSLPLTNLSHWLKSTNSTGKEAVLNTFLFSKILEVPELIWPFKFRKILNVLTTHLIHTEYHQFSFSKFVTKSASVLLETKIYTAK